MKVFFAVGMFLLPITRTIARVAPIRVYALDHSAACVSMASYLSTVHGERITPDYVRGNVRLTVTA